MTVRSRLGVIAAGAAAATLAAAGAAAPASGALSAPASGAPAPATPSPADCSIDYEIVTGGDGGFNAYVYVDNHTGEPAYWEASLYYGGDGPELSYWTGSVDVQTLGSFVLIRSTGTIDDDTGWSKLIGRGVSEPTVVDVRCDDQPYG